MRVTERPFCADGVFPARFISFWLKARPGGSESAGCGSIPLHRSPDGRESARGPDADESGWTSDVRLSRLHISTVFNTGLFGHRHMPALAIQQHHSGDGHSGPCIHEGQHASGDSFQLLDLPDGMEYC